MKRDQIGKVLQKRGKEITRRLVHEATFGVERLVRAADEDLRLQERVRVGENKCLSQLRLAARGSGHAGRGSHYSGDFAVQCALARRPGHPVDRVLQHAGTPWLYSGVAISKPSACRMASRVAPTLGGVPAASISALYNGIPSSPSCRNRPSPTF